MPRIIASFLLVPLFGFSQFEDISAIAGDLVLLSNQYVSPAAEAAVYQSSGGWYTSAKKKGLWELEVSLQGNLLFIPQKSSDFLIDESQLNNIRIQGSETTALTPTALGGDQSVVLEGSIEGDVFEFDSPEGLDQSYLRHAQIQASLGIWAGTSVIGRFSPKIKIKNTYYQLLGFGLQHNFSQWIRGLSESTFSLAGLATYSNYTVSDTFTAVTLPVGVLNSVNVDGESYAFSLIASNEVGDFTISGAVGLATSDFEYAIGGQGDLVLTTLNQALNTLDASRTNFKVDLGVDYRIDRFSVNTMLTFGSYSNLILGVNYNL
ncbi:MAG: hypothetical protein KJO37_11570 [Bacteroidia bacterium]|nr:hypothetical protein [Bacteroidia bacterium]